jgi:hypothetical protein
MSNLQKIYRNGDWVLYRDYKALADRIEELERKLAKCNVLMHAGFAEYKRRLTRAVKALELADAALSGANMNMSVVEREVKATIAELEGELDD